MTDDVTFYANYMTYYTSLLILIVITVKLLRFKDTVLVITVLL